jgi:F0F1-type ATP synthase assembly protein I
MHDFGKRRLGMKRDEHGWLKALGAAGNVGFTLAASIVAGLLLGKWVDQQLDTSPWITIAGILLGIGAGVWGVYQQISRK